MDELVFGTFNSGCIISKLAHKFLNKFLCILTWPAVQVQQLGCVLQPFRAITMNKTLVAYFTKEVNPFFG